MKVKILIFFIVFLNFCNLMFCEKIIKCSFKKETYSKEKFEVIEAEISVLEREVIINVKKPIIQLINIKNDKIEIFYPNENVAYLINLKNNPDKFFSFFEFSNLNLEEKLINLNFKLTYNKNFENFKLFEFIPKKKTTINKILIKKNLLDDIEEILIIEKKRNRTKITFKDYFSFEGFRFPKQITVDHYRSLRLIYTEKIFYNDFIVIK